MKKTGLIAMALIIGLLLGLSIPAIALSNIDAKQKRQIKYLKGRADNLASRLKVIENAPDTTTGLADDVNNLKWRINGHDDSIDALYHYTGKLGWDGNYNGKVGPGQVVLGDNHPCTNGQPRQATWNTNQLYC